MKILPWLFPVLCCLIILNFTNLVYFNIFTHSLPYGIYERIEGIAQRNDYAATCLTPEISRFGIERNYLAPGYCQTGTVGVLKVIRGLPGDHYARRDGFLEINGRKYPLKSKDSTGRDLKVFYKDGNGILGKGQYLLLSDFAQNSWDSRYWGPVGIQFILKPLWLFE